VKPGAPGLLIGLAGAIAGGILGHFAFLWIGRQGFYALMLPGALVGIGGGMFVKDRSVLRGILCGILALVFGLLSEWRFAPFVADEGLGYFLAHIFKLSPITLLMIAGGVAFGFWFSVGRSTANPSLTNVRPPPS
jgi:hypothetical protein